MAKLVRELRAQGKSEATISVTLAVVGYVFKFAARRLGWTGTIPTSLMLKSERPKLLQSSRRPIFNGAQLEQTLAAPREAFRTLFVVAALTGARVSELCGLTWADVRLADLTDAEIEFGHQVDRHGHRRPTKTDGSARTVPIPFELASILARHKLSAKHTADTDFVFATGTGRPVQQRNVSHALREAQTKAVDGAGNPTFPGLHQTDDAVSQCRFRAARFLRCTHSGTQLRRAHCSPARALMRWRSSSAIATGPSHGPSTCERSPTPADA